MAQVLIMQQQTLYTYFDMLPVVWEFKKALGSI
jgi:hypothetical protein